MTNILIWAIAWALAIWLAWQKQGDVLKPEVVLPLIILIAIGFWGWRKP
jgi:hypothetical protein